MEFETRCFFLYCTEKVGGDNKYCSKHKIWCGVCREAESDVNTGDGFFCWNCLRLKDREDKRK